MNVIFDRRTELEVLDRRTCLELLGRAHLGRLAVVVDGRPLVFPVNYALDGESVVFRTGEGTKLHGARGHEVAFEIDAFDRAYHEGWSVLVVGVGEHVVDQRDIERYEALPVRPWGSGVKPYWMRIRARAITGRRIPQHGSRT
ncbi:MAG TPA: pyridoxamine 5'-phosphate oxidase family protein [Acidimicrobiia bacterium]|nr:pyridoxamine 5'-phosphate oxidase family protein [Acidimicrobiia bacterium]